jgi:hypothetical protein
MTPRRLGSIVGRDSGGALKYRPDTFKAVGGKGISSAATTLTR